MKIIGKRFVVTGTLSRKRAEIKAAIEAEGAVVGSDVSASTDVLVVGSRPGSKLAKAEALNIPVWSEADLNRHLRRAASPSESAAERLAGEARKDMRASAKKAGVAQWSTYEQLVRDRILVQVLKDKPRDHGGIGQSRFGGNADLSSPDDWPKAPGLSFVFLCQIDLADIAPLDVGKLLPSSGLLSFFVGSPDVYGMHTEYRVEARVLYFPAGTELGPTWPQWGCPRQRGISFVLAPISPPWNSSFIGGEDPAYCDWYEEREPQDADRTRTAMLGFDRIYESELKPNEEMLLSCWCNEHIDYRFVEAVTLNFAIDRAALAERDWSAVRCWEGWSI